MFQSNTPGNNEGTDQVDASGDGDVGGEGSHIGNDINGPMMFKNNVRMKSPSTIKVFDITGCINIKNATTANEWIEFPWNHLWNWIPEEDIKPLAGQYQYYSPLSMEVEFMRGSTHQVTATNQVMLGVNHGASVYFYVDFESKFPPVADCPYTHEIMQNFADSCMYDGFTGASSTTISSPFFFPTLDNVKVMNYPKEIMPAKNESQCRSSLVGSGSLGKYEFHSHIPKIWSEYINMMTSFPENYYMMKPFFPNSGHFQLAFASPKDIWIPVGFYGADPDLRSSTYSDAYKQANGTTWQASTGGFQGFNQMYNLVEPWINKNRAPRMFLSAKVPVAGTGSIQQQFITLDS